MITSNSNSVGEKIKTFQGQELNDELGLNWIQFKWRNHDPAIGRFFNIDPLAEKYSYNSTYAFQENKLGFGVELEGLELFKSTGTAGWILHKAQQVAGGMGKGDNYLEANINSLKDDPIIETAGGFIPGVAQAIDVKDTRNAFNGGSGWDKAAALIAWIPGMDFIKNGKKFINITSQAANAKHVAKGFDAPYKVGSEVAEFTTSQSENFVRVFKKGENSAEGGWMMKAEDLMDADGNMLSLQAIQNKFSLDYVPDSMVDVTVPGNTKMITGTAAGRNNVGNGANTSGGGTQFELDQDIPSSSFTNQRPINN